MLDIWFKEIIVDEKQFLVEKYYDQDEKGNETYSLKITLYEDKLCIGFNAPCKTERELNELFEDIDADDCLSNYAMAKTSLN